MDYAQYFDDVMKVTYHIVKVSFRFSEILIFYFNLMNGFLPSLFSSIPSIIFPFVSHSHFHLIYSSRQKGEGLFAPACYRHCSITTSSFYSGRHLISLISLFTLSHLSLNFIYLLRFHAFFSNFFSLTLFFQESLLTA